MPPKKPRIRKPDTKGEFICPLCNGGFSRRSTVKEPHFPTCVAKLGNPYNLPWDAHESCWAKKPGRKPVPKGTAMPKVKRQPVVDGAEDGDDQMNEGYNEQHESDEATSVNDVNERDNSDEQEDMEALPTPLGWDSVNLAQAPLLNQDVIYDRSSPSVGEPCLISIMIMNQLANIPIMASRIEAGKGDLEALKMWELWNDMLPEGALSNVQPPYVGASQKLRQQAVVWMAQDVYAALLSQVYGLREQLKMVAVWRDIASDLGDMMGVVMVHDLLIKAIGENGPLLLNHFDA